MKFSIIIPTLNEANGIRDCLLPLQALREQAEIIIVDGGSTDSTRIRALPLTNKIILAPTGRAKQLNNGAARAEGDILIFLHADTTLPDQALALIDQQLKNSNKTWGRFDIQLDSPHWLLKIVGFMISLRSRLTGIATGDQAIFVTRTAFVQAGGYPELALMEDIALCQKLKKTSPPLCLWAKVTSSARRWQQNGIIKTILLMWYLRLSYYLGVDPTHLAQLYRAGQFWKI